MRLSIRGAIATVAAVAAIAWGPAPARAQSDPDPDDDPSMEDPEASTPREGIEGGAFDDYETADEKREAKVTAEYGVGVRFRTVFVPKPIFELFVDEASSGLFQPGFGLELSRRKGQLEMVLGFEYENMSPDDGFWLDKGDDPNVPEETPDYLEFDGLAWITADLNFLYNVALSEPVSLRMGGGLGIGVVLGEILQTDSTCSAGTDDIQQDCMADQTGMPGRQLNDPADLPPVFPVVNLLIGLQWRPIEKLTFNLDAGIRTVGFFGLSSNYYF